MRYNRNVLIKLLCRNRPGLYNSDCVRNAFIKVLLNKNNEFVFVKARTFLYEEKDAIIAIQLLYYLAKRGHGKSQYELAKCYFNGWGVNKDLNKAVYWMKCARRKNVYNARDMTKAILSLSSNISAAKEKKRQVKRLISCIKGIKKHDRNIEEQEKY